MTRSTQQLRALVTPHKKIRVVNRQRHEAEWARAYGSEERVEWVKAQPSVASGKRPCVNAHIKTGGLSRKADARFIVPLTDEEHHELHEIGVASFERNYGLSLEFMAAQVELRWRAQYRREDT